MRNGFVSVLVVFAGLSHAALSAQQRAPVIDMHMHAHVTEFTTAKATPDPRQSTADRPPMIVR